MKFVVKPLTAPDRSTPVSQLVLPPCEPLGAASRTRRLCLNEVNSASVRGAGPRAVLLGVLDSSGKPMPLGWGDPITEDPALGATEVWEIHNLTKDGHPIHIHEVQFQVVDRQREGQTPRPPEPWERGFKDTVVAYPNAITRVKVRFDQPGRYMWHCHMLEHEDNEMMRPFRVGLS